MYKGRDMDMIKKRFVGGVMAGLLIIIGCSVYLACEPAYVGAVLFSVALLCICFKGYALFTGKVGYLAVSHTKDDFSVVLLALLGNFLATWLFGTLVRLGLPNLAQRALTICTAKLTQPLWQTLIRAVFCGVLMYLAVDIFREHKSLAGIFLCVPVFILAGFEHSIADMGYFAISGMVDVRATAFLWVAVAGNAVGGMLLPALQKWSDKEH